LSGCFGPSARRVITGFLSIALKTNL